MYVDHQGQAQVQDQDLGMEWDFFFFLQNRCVPNDLGKLKPRQPAAAV